MFDQVRFIGLPLPPVTTAETQPEESLLQSKFVGLNDILTGGTPEQEGFNVVHIFEPAGLRAQVPPEPSFALTKTVYAVFEDKPVAVAENPEPTMIHVVPPSILYS